MSKTEDTKPGVGIDIGTMNLVAARETKAGKTVIQRARDAFLDLDPDAKKQLRMGKVDFIEEKDANGKPKTLVVLGDSALSMANLFRREARRPLQRGVIAAGELDSQKVLAWLLNKILGTPVVKGESCYYSVPAAPVDDASQDVIYHQEVFRKILINLGYAPTPTNEAMAIVYSQCAEQGFSGLSVSFGSGMCNTALAYQTQEALSFSVSRGGDWIDQHAAKALGITAAKVCAIKERGVDLLAPKNREEEALVVYIRAMIRYVLETLVAQFNKDHHGVDIPEPIPFVISGGTTLAGHFLDVFREEFETLKDKKGFPIPILDIVQAKDPMTAVAEGLLVLASSEDLQPLFSCGGLSSSYVYYYLRGSLKMRLIEELKDSFSKHPVYNKIVPYIQNRYAFTARPQFGIVVKGSSVSKVALSADNFVGTVHSYVMLAYVDQQVYPVEWVREDSNVVMANQDRMPSLPGVYYLEILQAPERAQDPGAFVLDPLYTVTEEPVLRFMSGVEQVGQLQNLPAPGTLRLWLNGRVLLGEGTDYTVDLATGQIVFLGPYPRNSTVQADYRYAGPTLGPYTFHWNTADTSSLPGVVLAFGKRAKSGDKVAVVIYPDRTETANAYGGKAEVSFDLDVLAMNDANQSEEIADLVFMFLWAEKKPLLEWEGIEVVDVSLGGEAEELYDETGDLYCYTQSVSVQLRADWEVHVPLPMTIVKVSPDPGVAATSAVPLYFGTTPMTVRPLNRYERLV